MFSQRVFKGSFSVCVANDGKGANTCLQAEFSCYNSSKSMAREDSLQNDLDNLTSDLANGAPAEDLAGQTEKLFAKLFNHKIPVIEYPKGHYDPQSQLYVGADSGQPALVVAGVVPGPGIPPGGVPRPAPPPRESTVKTTSYTVPETTSGTFLTYTANGTDMTDEPDTHVDWVRDTKADED